SAGIIKNGPGNMNFFFATNTYTGQTILNGGITETGDPNALGATGPGNETIINQGATLDPFSRTLPEDIIASGTGVANNGPIDGNGGLTGNITLAGDTTIRNNFGLLTISGPIGDGGNPVTLTKIGQGTIIFSSANTYRGTTVINNGILTITDGGALGASGPGID